MFWASVLDDDGEVDRRGTLAGSLLPAHSLELDDLLRSILGIAMDITDAEGALLVLNDTETGEPACTVTMDRRRETLRYLSLRPGQDIAGWVAKHGRPVIAPAERIIREWAYYAAGHLGCPVRSAICVPLAVNGRTVGALKVFNVRDDVFPGNGEVHLLSALADTAAPKLMVA